jgi:hypothetical protein
MILVFPKFMGGNFSANNLAKNAIFHRKLWFVFLPNVEATAFLDCLARTR